MPGPLRSRLTALFLLLLTPALGGWVVQAVHSCPAAFAAVGDVPEGQGHHDGPVHGGHDDECRCIGSCHAPAAAVLRPAATLDVLVAAPAQPPRSPAGALPLPTLRPSDRLPPSTAPPLG